MFTTFPGSAGLPRMTGVETTTTHDSNAEAHTHVRLSWGAIIAGVVLAIVMQLLLSMLGLGGGLSLANPNTGGTPGASSFVPPAVFGTPS